MKKQIILTVLTATFFTLTTSIAFADISNENDKREEIKAKIEQLEEKQAKFEDKKEEKVSLFKTILLKFKKTEIESLKVKTLRNFDVAIRNLENLAKRTGSRIEKVELQGKNVAESKSLLASTTSQIEISKAEYVKLSEIIPDNFDKDSKKEVKEAVKEQTKITKEAIQKAQSYLSETISSIKFGQDNDESTSTTTEDIK